MSNSLIQPHGGVLVNLLADSERCADLKERSLSWPEWTLNNHQLCDLELLLIGAFSPLTGFMGIAELASIARDCHLPDGTVWPLPVILDVDETTAKSAQQQGHLVLRDGEGVILAVVHVEETWKLDYQAYVKAFFGTNDEGHPSVARAIHQMGVFAVSGRVEGIQLPNHHDFVSLRHTPFQIRQQFESMGWSKIVGFQTRNPMHRVHFELTMRAAREQRANLLIHPVVGPTMPGDIDMYTRVRCYKAVMGRYPANTSLLSLLPLAMRMAGPREAILHAIIRQNYGCSHLIVGRGHASPGPDSQSRPRYGPRDAQRLFRELAPELDISMCASPEVGYVKAFDEYRSSNEISEEISVLSISGSELRQRLRKGEDVPEWFTFPEVLAELRKSFPSRDKCGICIFFTGLSGAGKSTVANILRSKLLENEDRPVTLLDGDIVRQNLSSELGFSREHRDLNIRRIGFVASEITKNRGIVLCASIAPYDKVRKEVRDMIEQAGSFILVHLATPLEECEKRDRKGFYAKARDGVIKEFTGISSPYQIPEDAEVVVDTTGVSPQEVVDKIIRYLQSERFLAEYSS